MTLVVRKGNFALIMELGEGGDDRVCVDIPHCDDESMPICE